MSVFVSKPVEIEAMQWATSNFNLSTSNVSLEIAAHQIVAWVDANGGEARYDVGQPSDPNPHLSEPRILVRTNSGWAPVAPGWWVMKGSEWFPAPDEGRSIDEVGDLLDHYPCDPDTFAKRWDPKPVAVSS